MRTIVLICLSDLAPIPLMKISVAYHMSLSPGHDGGLVKPLFWGPHARDGSQVSYKFCKIFPWNVYSWSFDKEILYNYWSYVIQSVLCFAEALVFFFENKVGIHSDFSFNMYSIFINNNVPVLPSLENILIMYCKK